MKIFLDLDGTLIDASERNYRVYKDVVEDFGGKPLTKKDYWEIKREKRGWSEILERSLLSQEPVPRFLKRFIEEIEEPENLERDTLYPKTRETLNFLNKKHQLYLVCLRRSLENTLEELKRLGIKDVFRLVVVGRENGNDLSSKKELIKQMKPSKEDMLVGDTEIDILVARDLGLTSVAVESGSRSREFLETLNPDFLIKDITFLHQILES